MHKIHTLATKPLKEIIINSSLSNAILFPLTVAFTYKQEEVKLTKFFNM